MGECFPSVVFWCLHFTGDKVLVMSCALVLERMGLTCCCLRGSLCGNVLHDTGREGSNGIVETVDS